MVISKSKLASCLIFFVFLYYLSNSFYSFSCCGSCTNTNPLKIVCCEPGARGPAGKDGEPGGSGGSGVPGLLVTCPEGQVAREIFGAVDTNLSKRIEFDGPSPVANIFYDMNPDVLGGSGNLCPSSCDWSVVSTTLLFGDPLPPLYYLYVVVPIFFDFSFSGKPIVLFSLEYVGFEFPQRVPPTGVPAAYSQLLSSGLIIRVPIFDSNITASDPQFLTAGILHFRVVGCVAEETSNGD